MDRSRFVVLKHTQPVNQIPLDRLQYLAGTDAVPATELDVHYDLMLESVGGLLTWALPHCPSSESLTMRAVQLPIHRSEYLEYEGPLSHDRGAVNRVMTGTWKLLETVPAHSPEGRFEQITVRLTPDNIAQPLTLTLKRLAQNKFQMTSQ